ncbi:aldo/keto reductase [Planococcus sp. 4-30]|uniref:aldo/keto reductase n=1 Tax=Planococcus sp. 4-30 TaxID=2874583 RepID=UPI001CBFFCAF|nr:aldo/keto reductase [Planococcus sp. 4-30]
MYSSLQDTVTLNNGVKMPVMGLGVFKVEDGNVVTQAVKDAIKNGYRSIDTASFYDNEAGVGLGIKESGIPREELFVTTKVWNGDHGYENTLNAFEISLEKLGLEYLDLYLIHWPVRGKYTDTWKALEKLYHDGKVRAIGVSNFNIHHLEDILNEGKVKPVINQVEYHPHLTQVELREFCVREGIQMEAWSPLKKGELLTDPVIQKLAEKHQKTPAQIILRWDIQNNVITIPKSIKEHRIVENADIFDFSLTEEDMQEINGLNINSRSGADPETFNF